MRKSKIVSIISIFILSIGLFSTLILEDGIANRIAEIVTVITAVIGAVALFLQFQRDKDINESSFMLEFWKTFLEKDANIEIQKKCDQDIDSKRTHFVKEDYDGILMYSQWLEALSAVINRNVLSFDFIDDMYNYIFFVFVNNKYIQKTELLPNIKYYQGIVKAYRTWEKYLTKKNKEIFLGENSLLKAIEENERKN